MPTYAVGDIQGCFLTLKTLLARIRFDPQNDRLWLVGDLVNRGPRSLEVLRWARSLGPTVTAVLGNHDLHLLGVAAGRRPFKTRDTFDAVLEAPDANELLSWLRRRPLMHRAALSPAGVGVGPHAMNRKTRFVLVHAGLLPQWTIPKAAKLAREVEKALQGGRASTVLSRTSSPLEWSDDLRGAARLRVIIDVFTRIRTCTTEGRIDLDFTGPPSEAPPGYRPWFSIPERASRGATVLFGHWAALGFRRGPGYIALDSGCVWGGRLTAVRLEDGRSFSAPFAD